MTPPTRNTSIRRSPRRTGKAPVARHTKAGKHKTSTPARKSLNGKSPGGKNNKGMAAADGASPIPVRGTVVKKRIVSSSLGVTKKKRKSSVPVRATTIYLPTDSESSYAGDNGEDNDDDDDDEMNAGVGDANGEAAQETTDEEGRGEGNDNGGDDSSDNTSETTTASKRRRNMGHLQAEEEERRLEQEEGDEDDHGDERDEEAVDLADASGRAGGENARRMPTNVAAAGLSGRNMQKVSAAGLSGEHILLLDRAIQIRGMSKSESVKNQQPHVSQRIRAFVKSELFRKIKFINNDAMFQRAINWVMDHEKVVYRKRGEFQLVYESVFNDALNQKRSSCEQAGGHIVRDTIAFFKEVGRGELFTMEELRKLRRSKTEREKEAFFWFFGTYIEAVCGRRNWGRQKRHALVSEATEKGGRAKTVTKSDEAFALLIFENYIDKWTSWATEGIDAEEGDHTSGAGVPEVPLGGKKKQTRVRGRYTSKKSGHCKYGGWSREGIARFNELYKLVHEDRACPEAAAMERELLAFCRDQGGGNGIADEEGDGGNAIAGSAVLEVSFVEAAWDLDE